MALPRTIPEVDNLDLSYMEDDWNESMIRDGLRAIVRTNETLKVREIDLWDYLAKFSPPENRGFMFCDDEIVSLIGREMEVGHSGSSYGWTMRQLELITKQGLSAHRGMYVS